MKKGGKEENVVKGCSAHMDWADQKGIWNRRDCQGPYLVKEQPPTPAPMFMSYRSYVSYSI